VPIKDPTCQGRGRNIVINPGAATYIVLADEMIVAHLLARVDSTSIPLVQYFGRCGTVVYDSIGTDCPKVVK
jgi:hypothetical protein